MSEGGCEGVREGGYLWSIEVLTHLKIERVRTILVLRNLNFTNFKILKSQLIFEISLQIFPCDHDFYRFQNNSKQYWV